MTRPLSIINPPKRRRLLDIGPSAARAIAEMGCEPRAVIEVLPHGRRWEWSCHLKGALLTGAYDFGGWRRPSESEVRGRCWSEAKAWRYAHEAAENAYDQIRRAQDAEAARRPVVLAPYGPENR